jgi:hypothetical protein
MRKTSYRRSNGNSYNKKDELMKTRVSPSPSDFIDFLFESVDTTSLHITLILLNLPLLELYYTSLSNQPSSRIKEETTFDTFILSVSKFHYTFS